MIYYSVKPEVPGGYFGDRVIIDRSSGKMVVKQMHYEFDETPPNDDLLTTSLCFFASEKLVNEIKSARLNGIWFDKMEVTVSDQFKELYPNKKLPKYIWLKIEGNAGKDDFGIFDGVRLIISEHALKILKTVDISRAKISSFEG